MKATGPVRGPAWIWYMVPALAIYTMFMAIPLFKSLQMSLYTGTGFQIDTFVGFDNYRSLFRGGETAQRFWGAFGIRGFFSRCIWSCKTRWGCSSRCC